MKTTQNKNRHKMMKSLKTYITEGTRYTNLIYIGPEDITGPLTLAKDSDGAQCIVIGKPFTNERDEQYILAKQLAKKIGYTIGQTIEAAYGKYGDTAEEVEDWVLVYSQAEGCAVVMPYDEDGVKAYKNS